MKSAFALQQFKKCIILFTVGIVCSSLTYVIYMTDPMTMILQYNLRMESNSLLYSMWKKPTINVYLNVYVFNITNPVEFLSGKEKLKVEEVGPYVYQEYLENHNITFNDNETLTYMPRRTVVYVPEMSVSDPMKDMVNVLNIPYLGISSALHDAGFFVNYPIVKLAHMLDTKPILNISTHDYLWGYEDTLVKLATGVAPSFFNFQKFGLLDRMYDEGDNIVTVNLRKNANMKDEKGRYLSIDKYNGSPGLSQWGYVSTKNNETQEENTSCNMIQGATEGVIFPSYLEKNVTFRIFRKAFCRALPIVFNKEVITEDGLPGYLYTLADDFADPPDQNSDNECLYRKTNMKKGLSPVTPCYYNIPSAVSRPHFLDADPSLLESIEGLNPNPEKHNSVAIVQQTFGIPIYVHSRMQTNLVIHHTQYNSKIAAFNGLTVPLFWFDLHIPSMPKYMSVLAKLVLIITPIVQTVLMYLLGIIGILMITLSLISILWILNQQKRWREQETNIDNLDLKLPLYNGQHTAINILPTIKKMTDRKSRIEIFN